MERKKPCEPTLEDISPSDVMAYYESFKKRKTYTEEDKKFVCGCGKAFGVKTSLIAHKSKCSKAAVPPCPKETQKMPTQVLQVENQENSPVVAQNECSSSTSSMQSYKKDMDEIVLLLKLLTTKVNSMMEKL
jgi:hypothetical protein